MQEICVHVIVGDYYVCIIHDIFLHCLNCLTKVVYLLFLPRLCTQLLPWTHFPGVPCKSIWGVPLGVGFLGRGVHILDASSLSSHLQFLGVCRSFHHILFFALSDFLMFSNQMGIIWYLFVLHFSILY